jgi:hypothetical protein
VTSSDGDAKPSLSSLIPLEGAVWVRTKSSSVGLNKASTCGPSFPKAKSAETSSFASLSVKSSVLKPEESCALQIPSPAPTVKLSLALFSRGLKRDRISISNASPRTKVWYGTER